MSQHERLARHVLHGIRIATSGKKARSGASKVGGSPDLPNDVAWPRVVRAGSRKRFDFPLAFLAQIALADVTKLDREKLLPRSGLLSFFTLDLVRVYEATGSMEGAVRVLHVPSGAKVERRDVPDDLPATRRAHERALSFSSVETWPQVEGVVIRAAGDGAVAIEPPRQAMLGHPYGREFPIGSDAKERLLLSLNADESGLPYELFGRHGMLYVHAPEAAIRARRWDEARHKEW